MHFAEALHEWHEFFFLFGTAGATLVALQFVAVSLGTGFLTAERADATRTFFSPVVLHFTAVFVFSAIAMIPNHSAIFIGCLVGLVAAVGLGVSIFATVKLLHNRWSDLLIDQLAYGLLPVAAYAALLVTAYMIASEKMWAIDILAASLLLLLMVNIRNAWDLTLDMVRRHAEPAPPPRKRKR
jgi:hypothetical protein